MLVLTTINNEYTLFYLLIVYNVKSVGSKLLFKHFILGVWLNFVAVSNGAEPFILQKQGKVLKDNFIE